ncbi:prepilin peptidase [Nucisporomicrobium flavum]|uniref:prepilin peptidase n=1 Tax=Nucisporomicrobium flavum TaxID=2785915 RepID=UPI0018F395A0|nr:prepilin peptidase [Nucisporomicrobium flavum]
MSPWLVLCSAVFGAAAAAFVPRVAHRLAVPRGTPARAACARCDTPFTDWVRAGAACSCAGAPVWTVVAGALAAGLLGAAIGPAPLLLVVLPATVLGVLLAVIDIWCLRLPDRVVAALAGVTVPPLAVAALLAGEPGRLGRAAVAAGLSAAAYGIIALLPGHGLGLGDVKLATVLGFVLGFAGWPATAAGLLAPHLINGPVALALLASRRAGRRTALPFGPALLAGALLGLSI